MIARWVVAGMAGIVALSAWRARADDLPAHILSLAREEHTIAEELKHLPDYTCTETIDRYSADGNRPLKFDDRIVIEIAIANRRELYAWPGQGFQERSVIDMVGQGFISDGDFSTMLQNVFVAHSAQISYVGTESPGVRRLLHYDFHIPVMSSGWRMFSRGRAGVMGSLGSFWLDADKLDLVRMRFDAEDLPAWSSDKSVEEDVDYAPVTIGDSRLLLPASAHITAIDFSLRKVQNHITFTNCRKYSSESTISFTESTISFDEPAGMTITVQLENPIDTARAAIGDEVLAAISGGGTLKGAIRSLDRRNVGIEWTRAEYPDRTASVHAGLTYIPVTSRRAVIPSGVRMTLRTVDGKTP